VQGREWGVAVVGRKVAAVESEARDDWEMNILMGKRKGTDWVGDVQSGGGDGRVNMLGHGTVRKKAKIETVEDDKGRKANELAGGLVRRKVKIKA